MLAEYTKEREAERVVATVYGINLLLTLVLVSVLWRYAVREQLVRPDLADQDVRMLTKRLTPTLGVYVGLIAVGVFLPVVAVIGYLALAFVHPRTAQRTPTAAEGRLNHGSTGVGSRP